jgi:hypothetical protein
MTKRIAVALWCATAAALLLGFGAPQADQPPQRQRLVVTTFDEQGVSSGFGDVVAELLIRSVNSPHYELVERRQVRRVLEEQAFAASDLTQPGDAVRYGRIADTRFVLVGSVYRVDGVYMVSARLVDSASGIVHESSRAVVQFRTVDEMAERINDLALMMGLRVPSQDLGRTSATGTTPTPTPSDVDGAAAASGPSPALTVRDYLEQVGDPAGPRTDMRVQHGTRTVEQGAQLRFTVRSDRSGFLSLFVVDAMGRVGVLVPTERLPRLAISAGTPLAIPEDVPFSLTAQPPFGPTRIKAIITRDPLPVMAGGSPGDLLRRVDRSDTVAPPDAGRAEQVWTSAEIEFLVVPQGGQLPIAQPRDDVPETDRFAAPQGQPAPRIEGPPARSDSAQGVTLPHRSPAAAIASAARCVLESAGPSADTFEALRWPLANPFVAGVDIGWRLPAQPATRVRIAVIDADFDPDDPTLRASFAHIPDSEREALRQEIRRNGMAPFRHGNRIASIIGGQAPWLPSVLPGTSVTPIRITTAIEGPDYRTRKGSPDELLAALGTALDRGCRVVNLSLCVQLDQSQLRSFSANPIWRRMESAGMVIVCAAGNSGENLDQDPSFPACLDLPNILCVGAVDVHGNPASWGEGLATATGERSVDVMAPGELVAVSDGDGMLALAGGTSYACAFATGAVAAIMEANPRMTPAEVVSCIRDLASPLPSLRSSCKAGLLRFPQP